MPYIYCEYDPNGMPPMTAYAIVLNDPKPDTVQPVVGKIGKWVEITEGAYNPNLQMPPPIMQLNEWLKSPGGQKSLAEQFALPPNKKIPFKLDQLGEGLKKRLDLGPKFRATIQAGERQTSHPALFALREGIVQFSNELYKAMHTYCDPITLKPEAERRGAKLYGEYTGKAGSTVEWNLMMGAGGVAGYIAAYLQSYKEVVKAWESEEGVRGYPPKGFSTCENMQLEGSMCQAALEHVGTCCAVLLRALIEDDKILTQPQDGQRREAFRDWAIRSLTNLYRLTMTARAQLPGNGSNALESLIEPLPREIAETIEKRAGEKQQLALTGSHAMIQKGLPEIPKPVIDLTNALSIAENRLRTYREIEKAYKTEESELDFNAVETHISFYESNKSKCFSNPEIAEVAVRALQKQLDKLDSLITNAEAKAMEVKLNKVLSTAQGLLSTYMEIDKAHSTNEGFQEVSTHISFYETNKERCCSNPEIAKTVIKALDKQLTKLNTLITDAQARATATNHEVPVPKKT